MALGYSEALRNARLNVVRDYIDAAVTAGVVKIYSGTRPVTGAALGANTLLASGTFSDPSSAGAATGILTFSAITYTNALDTGVAAWARIEDGDGTFVCDASVGTTGSGADIIVNSVDFVTGGPVAHVSAAITSGNA